MMNLKGNWVDLIIIIVIIFYGYEGYRHGFFVILADFVSFLLSLLISLRGYKFVAVFLKAHFDLNASISKATAFLLTAIISEWVLGFILGHLISRIPKKIWQNKWNKFAAVVPAIGEGLIIIAFVLTLVIALPIKPLAKKEVAESKIGGIILKKTSQVEKSVNEIFGGVIEDSLTYLTVEPKKGESVPLSIEVGKLVEDENAEAQLFKLVNEERAKVGVSQLTWDKEIVPVARGHARDMWERKYFSHYSPEGKDVGDRLSEANIGYNIAGENLAMAPTVQTAHTGLMNSEGHRANILEPKFNKVGIGVIDNGIYGKMFVQIFTD